MPRFKTVLWLLCWMGLTAPASAADSADKIIDLYSSNRLFNKKDFPAVRKVFAEFFEARHKEEIRGAFQNDYEPLMKWLSARTKLKETLFTALDERYDRIDTALRLFRDLWKQFPQQLDRYQELGIAVAVTWDNPSDVYDYTGHQVRTRSTMPSGLLDGVGNFKYLVDNELALENRLNNLPWEFLIFVVDHQTPLAERTWARQYFQNHRNGPSWHRDVPYDTDMLKSEKGTKSVGAPLHPKLQGFPYTLENIRRQGGVCAMQADFAARVAKSVGFPAVYVTGASANRGLHAWWTFVQVERATPEEMQFTLKSDGRLAGFEKDAFYTGKVKDPHTGAELLDTDMDRWLTLAGHDRAGLRLVTLLMRHYEWLAVKLNWDTNQRLAYLDKATRICPQCDEPWLALADLAKNQPLTAQQKLTVRNQAAALLTHFKNYPDFVTRAFGTLLLAFEPADQVKLNQQALKLCDKRPDLCCELSLKIGDAQAKDQKWQTAADGLISTINRFSTEGRYVPMLTKKLQEIVPHYPAGPDKLAQVYLDIVQKLYAYYRGDADATYPKALYAQAMAYFQANKMTNYASTLKVRTGN